jgi:hypothetical protein
MVRIRIRYDQANRSQDFSLWGGLDKDNLVELKASERYQFTRVTTTGRQQSGNYVDLEFDPVMVKYLRLVGTYTSTGTFEVSEFEVYAPNRTAALYVDDVKALDFKMPVSRQKLTGASWETEVIDWDDFVIKGVYIPAGQHKIAIVSEGNTADKYTLDKINFPVPVLQIDFAIDDDKVAASLDNGTDKEYGGFICLGIYTRNGTLVYSEHQSFDIGKTTAIPFEFSAGAETYPPDDYKYKIFCWDQNFVPLIDITH